MRRAKIPYHIVMHFGRNSMLQCRHCGYTFDPKLPQPMGALLALSNWFAGEHAECKISGRGLACTYCDQFGHDPKACPKLQPKTPREWIDGPDTGISSKAICRTYLGGHPAANEARPPQDPDDFGRCYRLLKLFPDMQGVLATLAERHPAWSPLVREWEALTELYEQEEPSGKCPKLFKLMEMLRS